MDTTMLITRPKLCKRWNVGRTSIQHMLDTGKLRLVKFGDRLRYPMQQVLAIEQEWLSDTSSSKPQ